MSWLFQSKLAKSHFYVWYLGSKEADGVRGSAVVLPVMRQLLKESFKKTPSKATVQISSKGLKLVQSVPAMSKSGKVKMQLVKFQIAANCITYSVTGRAPFDDVVGVVMLVLNPEMQSPMHVHCYRCDSAETAQIMHANIQVLLSRPEIQRSIMDLEHRLFLSGLLLPRTQVGTRTSSRTHSLDRKNEEVSEKPEGSDKSRHRRREYKMPAKVVEELKHRIVNGEMKMSKESLIELEGRSTLMESRPRLRMFGDTLIREGRSRSLDNVNDNRVSVNTRGSPFPRPDTGDSLGHSCERVNTLDNFWKSRRNPETTKL